MSIKDRQILDEYQALAINSRSKCRYAIKKGVIPKLDGSQSCVDCGSVATMYDHRDYEKPYDVEPVCRLCNMKRGHAKQHPTGEGRQKGSFDLFQRGSEGEGFAPDASHCYASINEAVIRNHEDFYREFYYDSDLIVYMDEVQSTPSGFLEGWNLVFSNIGLYIEGMNI